MTLDLSIIVLNWNTADETLACLESIYSRTVRHAVEVIVVDNASSDRSREVVAEKYPKAKLVVHSTNLGFCAGNNRAIPATRGRYVLFLNSDTVVTEGALDRLVDFADSQADIGIVGPKLLNLDGSLQYSCRRFPNLGAGMFRNTPLGRLLPKNRYTIDYLMSDWDHASVRDVDWVSGAALLIRREALDELGGFDEAFYMYCEDVDLCYRAHRAHWRVIYFPESVIYHIIGRASNKVPTRMTYMFHRSMYRFYRKHYAKTTPFYVRPIILPGLALRASGQLVKYRWRNILRRFRRP